MTELRDPQPYEILKAALDEAHANFNEKLNKVTYNINHKDGPMYILMDIEEVFAARAVLESRTDAFAREYAHMAEINEQMKAQRDEINRKFETFKRTLNQLNQEDEATSSPPAASKGRKRKK